MDVIRIDFSPFAECIAVNSELFAINSYTECNVECIVTRYLKDALNISLENTEFQMSSYTRGANYLLSNHTLNVMSNV